MAHFIPCRKSMNAKHVPPKDRRTVGNRNKAVEQYLHHFRSSIGGTVRTGSGGVTPPACGGTGQAEALPGGGARGHEKPVVHPVFHVSVLCKHKPNKIAHQQRRTPEPVKVSSGDEWEVKGILESRRRGQTTQYLVSWPRFRLTENLWKPEANLKNSRDLLEEFNSKFPEAAARH
ncbi:hypothetical protein PTTG_28457 [Puccinia triticina 1-1 BBBD Race 1]|uniref:Chromo domain-containing protein n=1 Tax=Puccinia triticina (isolate 1-1 / race 1 (BBBD)) TaxID=630390 RepID=A0A180GBL7_PUCT1|nr:hypothetical protein PTTG_28457 [Puccinia triticina 1-1 BBBD Race 1]